jgi:beta-galactosidase
MLVRHIRKALYLSFLMQAIFSSLSSAQQSPRHVNSLDQDWKFHLGHAADVTKDFNYSVSPIFSKSGKAESTAIDPKFNDNEWRTVQLPHDWAVELPFANSDNFDVMAHGYKPVGGLYPQNSIGWYRKKFTIAKSDSGKRYRIQFDGIYRDSKIWLNGFYLGNNVSGYVGVSYDVTDYINYKTENVLVVRVDASQYEGWFYEGAGIYRHVWLNQYDNVHINADEIFAHASVEGNVAVITVELAVVNESYDDSQVVVYTYLTDRNGKKVSHGPEQAVSLKQSNGGKIIQHLIINNPKLWSLSDPYLYKIVSVLKSGDKIVDQHKIRFGIRTITIDKDKGLMVNNTPVKVQGVNCHQDHAGVGSALPDYLQYYRIRLLKELGANAYRTSHNAPTPELLDACDSLGMLVLDENRLLNSSPEYVSQWERLILRDRSRTCVFMWSIGNEEAYVQTNSYGKRIASSLIQKQKALDPTRISTYAADLGNVYNGINEVIPVRGFNYREKFVAPYHHERPTQPIVGTEMGSTVTTRGIYVKDSVRGYVPDQDITAPWWASRAEAWWPIAAENDWFMGGFVWTGFDYRGEPTPYQWPNINSHFGVMDMCGFPKNIYYYYQSWWTDKDVLHISPHWNWKGKEGQPIDVWVNSNAESVELFLNNKSLGKKSMVINSHLQWIVPYAPGKLVAVGYRKGKKMVASIETTGAPYKLVLTPDRSVLTANGKDATVINVGVYDKQGRAVPDVNENISFTVQGNAKIIGVGNGDPSCHEPDQYINGMYSRSLFNGKCQLVLQSETTPGSAAVTAVGQGMLKASVNIRLVK